MWRVHMPTAAEGMTGYQDGEIIIRFVRTHAPDQYVVDIARTYSPQAMSWIAESSGIATKPGKRPRQMGWR